MGASISLLAASMRLARNTSLHLHPALRSDLSRFFWMGSEKLSCQSESSIDLGSIRHFHVEARSVDLDGNFYGMSEALILAKLMFMGMTQRCNDSRHRTQDRYERGKVGEPFFNS